MMLISWGENILAIRVKFRPPLSLRASERGLRPSSGVLCPTLDWLNLVPADGPAVHQKESLT